MNWWLLIKDASLIALGLVSLFGWSMRLQLVWERDFWRSKAEQLLEAQRARVDFFDERPISTRDRRSN